MTEKEIKEMSRRDLQVELEQAKRRFKKACAKLRLVDQGAYDTMVSAGNDIELMSRELASKRELSWEY